MSSTKPVNRDFSHKVAIITGSSSGIGAEIATLFASYGAQVVINGLNEGDVVEVAQRADIESKKFYTKRNEEPLQSFQLVGDVTDSTFARKLIGLTVKRFGKLDVLINNAGAGCLGLVTEPKVMEHFDRIMKLNVRSIVDLTHIAIPHLEKTQGNIVNISTILSAKPAQNNFMYCMSKASLDMFTKCCALELASKKIRVNSVNPGPIRTGFLKALGATEEKVNELYEALKEREPIGRVGESIDVATAVAFLVSDEASFITGSILTIDGGMQFV